MTPVLSGMIQIINYLLIATRTKDTGYAFTDVRTNNVQLLRVTISEDYFKCWIEIKIERDL